MKVDTLREWQNAVLNRDDHKCKICGIVGVKLQAHHIIPKFADLRFALETDNGITLCALCHISAHTTMQAQKRKNGYEPDLSDYEPGGNKY